MTDAEWERDFARANRLRDEGEYELAADLLRSLTAAQPNRLPAHMLLGYLHGEMEHYEDAVRCYRFVTRRDPRNQTPAVLLFLNLTFAGRFSEAAGEMEDFLTLNPGDDWEHFLQLCRDYPERFAELPEADFPRVVAYSRLASSGPTRNENT